MQDVMKPFSFFAYTVRHRNDEVVNEHLVGVHRGTAKLFDFPDLDAVAVKGGVEKAQAFRTVGHLLDGCGASQDEHFVCNLGRGGPDLLSTDDVMISFSDCLGFQAQRVEAGIGFRHGKARLVLPSNQRRQHALLLLSVTKHHDRVQPENVHVQRRGTRHPGTRSRDNLHHDGCLHDAHAAAAVFGGHGNAKPASLGHRGVKIMRKAVLAVLVQPVVIIKVLANVFNGGLDGFMVVGKLKVHLIAAARQFRVRLKG